MTYGGPRGESQPSLAEGLGRAQRPGARSAASSPLRATLTEGLGARARDPPQAVFAVDAHEAEGRAVALDPLEVVERRPGM